MTFFRTVMKSFFVFLLVNFITLLALSYIFPKVLVQGLLTDLLTNNISNNFTVSSVSDYSLEDNVLSKEEIKEILNTKEMQSLMNKYMDITISSAANNEIKDIDIEKDIIDFINNNKDLIEKYTGREINNDEYKNLEDKIHNSNLNKSYTESLSKSFSQLPQDAMVLLKGYNFFVSNTFRIIIIILITIDMLFLCLFNKSIIKVIYDLSYSLAFSGIFILIGGIVVRFIVKYSSNFVMDTNYMLYCGVILLIVGIIIRIVNMIIDMIIKNNKGRDFKYEVS